MSEIYTLQTVNEHGLAVKRVTSDITFHFLLVRLLTNPCSSYTLNLPWEVFRIKKHLIF